MTTSNAPLPGLATDEELAAGRSVITCADCDRELSSREARTWGRGRGCRRKHGADGTVRRPGRFEVEQDELPGV